MEKTPPASEDVTPTATPPTVRPSTPARRMTRRGRIALAAIVVIVGAALTIPRHPTGPGASSPADGQPERVEPVADVAPTSAPVAVTPAIAAKAVKQNRRGGSPKSAARIGASAPLADAHSGADSATVPAAPETPTAGPALASASAVTTGLPPVTITGCLEVSVDADEFRLSETEGVDAPKSRSWKSGFLAKRPASISIVPSSSELPLSKHVGERVTVSGTLIERQMQVRTLRRVASSCDGDDPGPRITA